MKGNEHRNYILIWAAALAVCIFSMTPVYYDMIETAGTLPSGFTQGGFWETLDVSLTLLMEPLGMYSFLTGFFMIAGGVFGMHLGLSLSYRRMYGKHSGIFIYKTLWTADDLQGENVVCACWGMCDRNFLSTGFIFDDDAVSPWISCGRIPVGGRLLCPPYAFFRTAGIDGRNIPSQ